MFRPALVCVLIAWGSLLGRDFPARMVAADRRCSLIRPPPRGGFDPSYLVKHTDVVVRARADSTIPIPSPRIPGPQTLVRFAVLEVIDSGSLALPRSLAFQGALSGTADFNTGQVPYRWVRSDGMRGSCSAYTYQQGGEFLLLLRGKSIDSLTPYWAALQPTNEQVTGAGDAWVQWVRTTRRK